MDRIKHEIAALLLDKLGASAARIHDGAVEAKFPGQGAIRIVIERAR